MPKDRILKLAALGLLSLAACGCRWTNPFTVSNVAAPVVFSAAPSKEQLISAIQRNTDPIQQLQSEVRVTMDGLPSLSGSLAVQRPNNLRLKAGLFGVSQMGVDLGSNDELFWIWTRSPVPGRAEPIYFARHEQYQRSAVRQALHIEPQWILDALGLVQFDPAGDHQGPFVRPDGRLELRSIYASAGQQMTRRTVIDPQYGWVVQQSLYADGNLVAYVDSLKHQYLAEHNVSLPRHLEIHVFSQGQETLKLAIDSTQYRVNSLYVDPQQTWTMPTPPDVPIVDISRLRVPASASAQRQPLP